MRTKNISPMVSQLLRNIEAGYSTPAHRIWDVWADAVGPDIARRAAPIEFKKGKLTIGVAGAAWLQQMVFLSPQIIEAVNSKLEKPLVKTLKPVAAGIASMEADKSEPLLREGPLEEAENMRIEAEVASIADESLREAIKKARETALRRINPKNSQED